MQSGLNGINQIQLKILDKPKEEMGERKNGKVAIYHVLLTTQTWEFLACGSVV